MYERVLPLYLTIDTSLSMTAQLREFEGALQDLRTLLLENFWLGETVRVAIVQFSTQAELALPLSDLTSISRLPRLNASGSTNLADAFELLRTVIATDIRLARAKGTTVLRPIVMLFSDGKSVTSWQSQYDRLVAEVHPSFVCVGLPGSSPEELSRIATLGTYVVHPERSNRGVLARLVGSLLESTATSTMAHSVEPGEARLTVLPDELLDVSGDWI